ncbi:MAG: hypothetical protein ABUS79_25490 [Pseudomonadota bacterium]
MGALINRASLPVGLDDAALDRLLRRLRRGQGAGSGGRWRRSLRWALAAFVLTTSGAVVGAELGVWRWPRAVVRRLTGRPALGPEPATRADQAMAPRKRVAAPSASVVAAMPEAFSPPVVIAPPLDQPTVALEPLEAPPDVSANAVRRRARTDPRAGVTAGASGPFGENATSIARGPAPAAVAAVEVMPLSPPRQADRDTTLAEESLLLGRALASLRKQRDPVGALAELDRYHLRFPAGLLRNEAQRARADALLMAGRLAEARVALSGLRFGAGVRDRELRLIRAELAAESDCAVALDDFERVRAESPSGALAERALWGRAACHAKLGNEARARADFTEYLAHFPEGPHAAAVRARLRN